MAAERRRFTFEFSSAQIVFLMEQVGGSTWKGGQRELLGFTYLIICFPLDCLCLYCLFRPGIPPAEACSHVGIFSWRFLLEFPLTWLSSLLPDLRGGLGILNRLRIFLLRGKRCKTLTGGKCVHDFSDEERGGC